MWLPLHLESLNVNVEETLTVVVDTSKLIYIKSSHIRSSYSRYDRCWLDVIDNPERFEDSDESNGDTDPDEYDSGDMEEMAAMHEEYMMEMAGDYYDELEYEDY